MNPNNHIHEFLDYYCSLDSAGYAVLLSGKWGCGKSHFISQFQEAHKEDLKFIYVSLYGMQKTSQIDDAFFEQLHPVLSHKGMDIAGKVLKSALRATLRFDLDGDSKSDSEVQLKLPDSIGFLNNSKGHILIFDDLERCCMPMAHVLGYIYSFVEHSNRHVILIADESRIRKKEKKPYAAIKEKLIGQSFEIQVDVNGAIESFCPMASNEACRNFLTENIPFILELFTASKYNNLRVLKKVIQDFDRIYSMLPEQAQNHVELFRNVLGVLTMLSFETRCGGIAVEHAGKLLQASWEAWLGEEKDDDPHAKLQQKYRHLLPDYSVPDRERWKEYMRMGIFDPSDLKKAVLESVYFQDANTPSWIQLWHGLDLNDDAFELVLGKVGRSLIDREYKKVPVIKHLFGLFLWMAQKGLYNKTESDVVTYFHFYVETLIVHGELEFEEQSFSAWDDAHAGLGYFSKDEKCFGEFCSYLTAEVQKIREADYPAQATALLEIMKQDTGLFYQQVCLCNSGDTKYHRTPIFKHVSPERFVETLKTVSANERRRLVDVFTERYKFDEYNKLLVEELEWLNSVKDLLSTEAESHKGKISGYVFHRLVEDGLTPAIANLQKSVDRIEQL